MNTKLIKSEIEKLARIATSWDDAQEIDAIERDLALDKVKHIYELLRFGGENAEVAPREILSAALFAGEEQAEEQDVEVEFLFAEDDPTEEDEEQEGQIVPTDTPAEQPQQDSDEAMSYKIISEPEPIIEKQPLPEPQPKPEPELKQEPEVEQKIAPEVTASKPATPTSGNLFGMEEVRRPRASKHQRMMSIYNDVATEKSHEKQVDISKIFDFGLSSDTAASAAESSTENYASTATIADSADKSVTLGDIISPNAPTLADTIAAPAPLAEEITHSKITSLSQGVGINDKFLMIRDLFDGDDEAYDQTIADLDSMESFDDCIIYIAENFEWNPDSEGAKFIMQLLERKHS